MSKTPLTVALLLMTIPAALSTLSPMLWGQGTLTVEAEGTAEAATQSIQMVFRASVKSDDFEDAVAKLDSLKKRARKALAECEIDGLTQRFEKPTLQPANAQDDVGMGMVVMAGGGMEQPTRKPQVNSRVVLEFPLAGIDTAEIPSLLGKVLDLAGEAKLKLDSPSTNPMVFYSPNPTLPKTTAPIRAQVADSKKLRNQAYAAAIQAARDKAEQLASAAGIEVGSVHSVKVTQPIQIGVSASGWERAEAKVALEVIFKTK